jgi:amino acid transporter
MPRSSLIYNWTYSSFGELPAFIIGWTSLLDYTIAITIVIRSWSDHVDLLFDGSINQHLQFVHNLTTNIFIVDSIIDERIDTLSLIAVCIATILLSGSLRVGNRIG